MSAVDDYLRKLEPAQTAELERVRRIARQLAPEAEEVISYGLPTLKLSNKPLVYFGAFKDHLSIFPASGAVIAAMGDKLAGFKTSKGTLRFSVDEPIPESTIEEMLKLRLKEIENS